MKAIKVIKGGPLTTVQDEGRVGYQKFGMPVAGAMDKFSYKMANLLVDNKENEAALEFTMMGPELKFMEDAVIAITGANAEAKIDGKPITMWRSVYVKKGSVLSFSRTQSALRGYIAFKSGLDLKEIMGSKSTYLRGKLGGHNGRKLKEADILEINENVKKDEFQEKYLAKEHRPNFDQSEIRVIMGPQDDYFIEKGIDNFLNEKFKVSSQADRMGYRLQGSSIEHKDGADIISDGIAPGSVQVPGDGKAIIMLADRQTTGGYTKIATVITVDIDKVAQKKPGDTIYFKKVNLDSAQKLLKERQKIFKEIKKEKKKYASPKYYNIKLDGEQFNVKVEEIIEEN